MINRIWIAVFLLISPLTAAAESLNQISLEASASAESPSNYMTAELAIDKEGPDASVLASKSNKVMQTALAVIKRYPQIQASTRTYNTSPVYDVRSANAPQTIHAWQLHQSIAVRSADFTAMQSLIGQLQKYLTLTSIRFSLSSPARLSLTNSVTQAAIKAFRERASLVAKAFGARSYILNNVIIDNGISPPPRIFTGKEFMVSNSAPTFESGENTVKVTVRGSIILNGVPITNSP